MKKEIKDDWDILFSYWENGQLSCTYECVKVFTCKYPNIINGWIVKADVLKSFARYSEGIRSLNSALKIKSNKSKYMIYHQFGHLYKEKGDITKAKSYYKKALDLKETNEGYNFLGSCFSIEGDFYIAKQYFNKAIEVMDSNPDESYYNLGVIARSEGFYYDSKTWFEKAIKEDSEYVLAKEALVDVNNVIDHLRKNKLKLIKKQ